MILENDVECLQKWNESSIWQLSIFLSRTYDISIKTGHASDSRLHIRFQNIQQFEVNNVTENALPTSSIHELQYFLGPCR